MPWTWLLFNSLTEWSTKNQLPFNINKCAALQFKSNFTIEPSSYSIDDHILSIQSQHRDLALYFQPILTGHHIMKLL